MIQQIWTSENRKNIVCVDSYDDGVLKGRLYHPYQDAECFSSLSQFLLKMEDALDGLQLPQAYNMPRTFSNLLQPEPRRNPGMACRGVRATFEVKVIFRQHTSWQGVVTWREGRSEHSFRSVLELVILMDSALRSLEGRDAG